MANWNAMDAISMFGAGVGWKSQLEGLGRGLVACLLLFGTSVGGDPDGLLAKGRVSKEVRRMSNSSSS